MTDFTFRILIALIASLFVAICWGFAKPESDGGRLSLKLCTLNALGWLLILLLSDKGHPPAWLIGFGLFWLINLVVLPAAVVALWVSYRNFRERKAYVGIAALYICLNFVVLFLLPILLLR